jgi:hypothetical protein
VKLKDPDGRILDWVQGEGVSDADFATFKKEADNIMKSNTTYGRRFKELNDNPTVIVTINVNSSGETNSDAISWTGSVDGKGSDSIVNININDRGNYRGEDVQKNIYATLVHEVSGHAYLNFKGASPYNGVQGQGTWLGCLKSERDAVAMENEYRAYSGLQQRFFYYYGVSRNWNMPIFDVQSKGWYLRPHIVGLDGRYVTIIGPAARWK